MKKILDDNMTKIFFGMTGILELTFSEMRPQQAQKFCGLVVQILKALSMIVEVTWRVSEDRKVSREILKYWWKNKSL